MHGEPHEFWGKLQKQDDLVVAWHPLVDHCADVTACAAALLERTLLRRRLARLANLQDLSDGQVARLCLLVALHDIGKFNLGFQRKGNPRIRTGPRGHVHEILALLHRPDAEAHQALCRALDVDRLNAWAADEQRGIEPLLLASLCHHGRPIPPSAAGTTQAIWWKPDAGLDPFAGIAKLVSCALAWLPDAQDAAPLPAGTAFQHAFSGLVMLADWLGSDTKFFPYTEPGETNRYERSLDAAREALRRTGLDTASARAGLDPPAAAFARVLGEGRAPRPLQRGVLAVSPEPAGALLILEAETGSGKTEAAFAHYLALFKQGLVDGMYFALPTRTAATQIYQRICEAVARAFPDPEHRPPVILAVPGYLEVDGETGVRLAHFDVLWHDDPGRRFRYRGWAAEHPKRYLAGAVSVGTIDQVLLAALAIEHAHLRATALLRQLLVVDEVHASDAYMSRILEEVLRHHVAAGGHALLMSATLGSALREPLLGTPVPALAEAQRVGYPLLTNQTAGAVARCTPIDGGGLTKHVAVEIAAHLEDPEAIASRALAAAAQGACVLVLRNTVSACVATQRALLRQAKSRGLLGLCFACEGIPAPHHARFSKEDRTALDRALEGRLGKSRSAAHAGGCVAVTTQTVQQSLDLDADVLLTDLCPMDVLLQRIGRLHRHQRSRPFGFGEARAVIFVPVQRALHQAALLQPNGAPRGPCGLGSVYADLRVLEATWQVLEQNARLTIPDMNRALVEQTTHPEALAAAKAALGPRADKHVEWLKANSLADRLMARRNLIDWKQPFDECSFLSADLGERIATRLGEQDRLVRFEDPPQGPFGRALRELTLPAWLLRGMDSELLQETAYVRESGAGRIVFSLDGKGERPFLYDCLGLRPLVDDPEEDLCDV